MGSGKTEWAIKYMNAHPNKRFLYISPFIKEYERVKERCTDFHIPLKDGGKKIDHIKEQIKNNLNIASTHALFGYFDDECIQLIKNSNYTLIMDEVLEIVELLGINKTQLYILKNSGAINIDKKNRATWSDKYQKYQNDNLELLRTISKQNNIFEICGETLMWIFPPEVFAAFDEVYLLTYFFESNIMYNYFKVNHLEYIKKSVRDGKLVDFYCPDLSKYKDLIHIYDGKLNTNIKQNRTTFSLNWYNNPNNAKDVEKMKRNIYNWFRNISGSQYNERMWTSFNEHREILKNKGYTKNYVVNNCRSTNDYMNRSALAYTINRFYNPMLIKYFSQMGYPLNQDLFALSEMIQWIWRSRIRNDQPINIYVPSNRMRGLLKTWLNKEFYEVKNFSTKKC